MKRRSTNYSTPDSGAWQSACDDIFLARFRGRPCIICGATHGNYNGRVTRSCGHHLAEKGMHRKFRYDERLITILCVHHHSRFARDMSPHADDTAAVKRFYRWLDENRPEQARLLESVKSETFNKEWTYRQMYEMLSGEIRKEDKDGNPLPMREWKPKNHARKVKELENED